MQPTTFARTSPRDPLFRIVGASGDELLVIRLSDDGAAGLVVISTPSVTMTVRLPEIAGAFAVPGQPAPDGPQPWSAVHLV